MLNNIKISQTTNEIILNVNVIAEIHEILEELEVKLPKLRDFYQSSTIPIRITGRLFTDSEIEKVKKLEKRTVPLFQFHYSKVIQPKLLFNFSPPSRITSP